MKIPITSGGTDTGADSYTVCNCTAQCPQCGTCCQYACPHRAAGAMHVITRNTTSPLLPLSANERIAAALERIAAFLERSQ